MDRARLGTLLVLALIGRAPPVRGEPAPVVPVVVEDDDWLDDLDEDEGLGEEEAEEPDHPDEPEDDLGDEEDWDIEEASGEEAEDPGGEAGPGDEEDWGFDEDGEEEAEDVLQVEGADTAAIYRKALRSVEDLPPEEEILAWEEYLRRYPGSRFREQIERRVDELSERIYDTRIQEDAGSATTDARHAELDFATGVQIEPIDPRTRARVGVEWGFPNWGNLLAEYEHAITRKVSAHVGIRHRYTGWNLEVGTRVAPIKSPRTNTLVTGLLDLRFNANPFFLGVRPQVAVGHRLDVAEGLDLQAQLGTDLELRDPFSWRFIAGANAFLRLSETVGMFLETTVGMRPGPEGASAFAFNLLGLGMRFTPRRFPADILFSASAPYYQNYWGYHYGSAMVVAEYTF